MKNSELISLWQVSKCERELLLAILTNCPHRWEEWRTQYPIDESPHVDVHRLLVKVYEKKDVLGVAECDLSILGELARYSWARSALLRHSLKAIFTCFAQNQTKAVVLSVADFNNAPNSGASLRPIGNGRILIHHCDILKVHSLLLSERWSLIRALDDPLLDSDTGLTYRNSAGACIELTCSPIAYWKAQRTCDRIFQNSILAQIEEAAIRVAHPDDWLFLTLVNSSTQLYNRSYWVADAAMAIQAMQSTIDWRRLITLAEIFNSRLRLWQASCLLKTEYQIEIPENYLKELGSAIVSFPETLEHFAVRRLIKGKQKLPPKGLFVGYVSQFVSRMKDRDYLEQSKVFYDTFRCRYGWMSFSDVRRVIFRLAREILSGSRRKSNY